MAVLAQTPPAEERTQARLLDTLGRVAARYKDEEHLAIAADRLTMAARSYRSQGLWSWLAYTLAMLGIWVHAHRGATDQAIAAIDESLQVIPDRRQQRAVILTFRAEILDPVGRYEEAAANLAEAEDIAQVIGDVRVRAYVAWERAQGAVAAGRRAGHAGRDPRGRVVPRRTGSTAAAASFWPMRPTSSTGSATTTWRCSTSTGPRSSPSTRTSRSSGPTATILARSGDPEEAERRLVALAASPWCEPTERWRVQLLRAVAAQRRGDPAATALAHRRA